MPSSGKATRAYRKQVLLRIEDAPRGTIESDALTPKNAVAFFLDTIRCHRQDLCAVECVSVVGVPASCEKKRGNGNVARCWGCANS